MSRKLFNDMLVCQNQGSGKISGSDFEKNQEFVGVVSSRAASTTDKGVAMAPIIEGILSMASGYVSAAITEDTVDLDNPTFYIEIEDVDGSVSGILYDSENNTYRYEFADSPQNMVGSDTTPVSYMTIIPRMVELLYFNVAEFVEYYEVCQKEIASGKILSCLEAIKLCDLLYRHSIALSPNGGFDIDMDDFTKVDALVLEANSEGKPINLTKDITNMMGCKRKGTFTKLTFNGASLNNTLKKEILDLDNIVFGQNETIPEKFLDPKYWPKVRDNWIKRTELYQLLNTILLTENTSRPVNNIILIGPTGSGKTTLCSQMAHYLKVPKFTVVGHEGQDGFVFTGIYINGKDGATVYQPSLFSEMIQTKCVIEIVEANNFPESAMANLFPVMDADDGYLTLDTFEKIKRNPKCIIISTFNPGYAGTKTPNRAFVRRSPICKKIDKVPDTEIKSMLGAISEVENEKIIEMTYQVFNATENFIQTEQLDAEVSMEEYANFARFVNFGIGTPIEIYRDTIANKLATNMDFDNEIVETICTIIQAFTVVR